MKSFALNVIKFILIGLTPLYIVGPIYFYFDPFKVIYDYKSYYYDDGVQVIAPLDHGYVSTSNYINNREKEKYNSFIFGNSRSLFYEINDWKKHLDPTSNCYHFDASGEALYGINKKIEFIDKNGDQIKHMLLVLDRDVLIQAEPRHSGATHLNIISPVLVDQSNITEFHKTFFTTFIQPNFLYSYLDWKISNKIKPYMRKEFVLDVRRKNYDYKTNEIKFTDQERLIKDNKFYTAERMSVFYKRDTTKQKYFDQAIKIHQKNLLSNIASIAKKHNTQLKVIINPLYNQHRIHGKDLDYLEKLFGKDKVFDFSGINNITNDYKNYYEISHYRPHISREIMNIIYSKSPHN